MWALNPNDAGQLFDPHLRPSSHWSLESQSPSSSEQEWQAQNPSFPLITFAQLTENRSIFFDALFLYVSIFYHDVF